MHPLSTVGSKELKAPTQFQLDRKCVAAFTSFGYSALGCQCRLDKGGTLFRRTRYQQGSLILEERKRGPAVWVYRWWEKKHQREADTSQGPDRELEAVLNRICGASGSGCPSTNRQQSFQPQESSSDKREHLMGALLSRRVASKGAIHARRIHRLCEELDSPSMGQRAAGRTKNRRGGTLTAGSGSGGRDQGQTQVCDVGFVFARRALGVLWPQSHLIGNSSREPEEREVQALAFASVQSVKKRPCSCHRSK